MYHTVDKDKKTNKIKDNTNPSTAFPTGQRPPCRHFKCHMRLPPWMPCQLSLAWNALKMYVMQMRFKDSHPYFNV